MRIFDQIVQLVRLPLAHIGDHTLMRRAAGFAIELFIGDAANRYARLLCRNQELLQPVVFAATGAHRHDAARFERLANRVNAVDEHGQLLIY